MLLVGANDGQLHAFDAGIWDGTTFTAGKGTELFSYMPRIGMAIVRDQTEGERQIFGVDGTPRISDVFIDPSHNGTPDPTQREWRTVAIGGFREGGSVDGGGRISDTDFYSGYYALDLTQPDSGTQGDLPSCLSLQNQAVSNCGTLPFPAVLWEFSDTYGSSRMDEDQNGVPDLGQTWSVPTIGRIKVMQDDGSGTKKEVKKYVAIFGGGMDHDDKISPKRGTYLYMVDIETGKVLYKHSLVGAVPSDVAVLDVDLDGLLDTIYVGTTAGLLYKVDIKSAGVVSNVTFNKNQFFPPLGADVQIPRINDPAWDPFPIFDAGGKPIYIAPTAFFVSELGQFAIALGTGDREDLWQTDAREGRFYLFIDDNFTSDMVATSELPKHETDYKQVLPADNSTSSDYVLDPDHRGWYLKLPANQRVITQPFGLSGILIFSSFLPDKTPCSSGGSSNLYVVFANNGNPVMKDNGTPVRSRLINDVVTNPVVEQGQTKNSPTDITDPTPPEDQMLLDEIQAAIVKSLKSLAPKECKFANYWFNVNGVRSDTGIERYATIPVCAVERNWKDN
jgi:type IV pilus assembly protein PilY1